MPQQFKKLLALWFVVQIVLPFTAPLHTCDLADLLGTGHQHSAPASPLSSARQMEALAEAEANAFVSPLATSTLRASADLVVAARPLMSGPLMSAFDLSPSPQVHQSVLRV